MQQNTAADAQTAASCHIGKIIESELRSQGHTVSWLGRCLNCNRRNVYNIFSRQYIDTGLLLRISGILGVDFFKYYSEELTRRSS